MCVIFAALAFGCAYSSKPASEDSLPSGVLAAFNAEHPYAKIHNSNVRTEKDGQESYVIPFTRPDGTEGSARYTEAGVLLDSGK
jgi:hypothetical protein